MATKDMAWFKARAETDVSAVFVTDEELAALRQEAIAAAGPERWMPDGAQVATESTSVALGAVGSCHGIPLLRRPREAKG